MFSDWIKEQHLILCYSLKYIPKTKWLRKVKYKSMSQGEKGKQNYQQIQLNVSQGRILNQKF